MLIIAVCLVTFADSTRTAKGKRLQAFQARYQRLGGDSGVSDVYRIEGGAEAAGGSQKGRRTPGDHAI